MIRSVPCGPQGPRAIARAKTRVKSRAQLQRGASGLASGSAMPGGRGGGVSARRQLRWAAETAARAHQGAARQGHERGQRLPAVPRREAPARGPVRPRVGEGVDERAVGGL